MGSLHLQQTTQQIPLGLVFGREYFDEEGRKIGIAAKIISRGKLALYNVGNDRGRGFVEERYLPLNVRVDGNRILGELGEYTSCFHWEHSEANPWAYQEAIEFINKSKSRKAA